MKPAGRASRWHCALVSSALMMACASAKPCPPSGRDEPSQRQSFSSPGQKANDLPRATVNKKYTALSRSFTDTVLPFPSPSWPPILAAGGETIWALSGKMLIGLKREGVLRKVELCPTVIPTSRYHYYFGLFADERGAVTVGQDRNGHPVLAKVDPSGKLDCETRRGEYFVEGVARGAVGVWKVEVNGRLVLRTARGKGLPSPPGGVPMLSQVFAAARNRIWLQIWEHDVQPEHKLLRTLFFDGNGWSASRKLPKLPILDIAQAPDGKTWALLGDMLAVLDGSRWKVDVPDIGRSITEHNLAVSGTDVWLISKRKIWLRANGKWQQRIVPPNTDQKPEQTHVIDETGSLVVIVAPPPGSKSTSWLLRRFDPPAKTNL